MVYHKTHGDWWERGGKGGATGRTSLEFPFGHVGFRVLRIVGDLLCQGRQPQQQYMSLVGLGRTEHLVRAVQAIQYAQDTVVLVKSTSTHQSTLNPNGDQFVRLTIKLQNDTNHQ